MVSARMTETRTMFACPRLRRPIRDSARRACTCAPSPARDPRLCGVGSPTAIRDSRATRSSRCAGVMDTYSRLQLTPQLADLREHFLQRPLVLGVHCDTPESGELRDRLVHRLEGVRRVVPASREQTKVEGACLIRDLTHDCAPARSAPIEAMVRGDQSAR